MCIYGLVPVLHLSFQLGFQWQRARSDPFIEFSIRPTYGIGFSTANPGLPATELNAANALLALHAGYVGGGSQAFNVSSRTSGFVPGAANKATFVWHIPAFYVQDRWRIHPRLTVSFGLRYEMPVDNGNSIATLRSNLLFDFSGSGTGRQAYQRDGNNLAPQAGLASGLLMEGATVRERSPI